MKPELQKLCEAFIANRDAVKQAFKAELDAVYPVCANIFLAHGKTADAEQLKACKAIIKSSTSFVNNFRGSMFAPSASLLSCAADPEAMMAQAAQNYKLLKEYFSCSEQMVLAAMILTDMATPERAREQAQRGKALYKMMKEKHRFLTGQEDSVFAVLLSFSDKPDEELIDEIEACFSRLKGMAGQDHLQTVSQILALSDRPVEEKCARFQALFDGVRAAGMKYGKSYELPVLAALSVCDAQSAQLVSDIAEANDFLAAQKGYKGLFGADKRTRLMHAAMLVGTLHAPQVGGDVVALASMLSIVAAQMLALMIIVSGSASSVSAAASH